MVIRVRLITASLLLLSEAMDINSYNNEHDERITITFIGVEVLYTIHNLEMKDQGDGFAELLSELGFTWNVMNITATYNF